LIPDGYGPASATLARDFLRWRDGTTSLALDSVHVGSARTFAADSRVTDSAAGATAYAAATKTYNGAIAVDSLKRPVATIFEAAKARGMPTGLVATSRITHATPASFVTHVPQRWMENEIASQLLSFAPDVVFGGGRRHFVPDSVDGSRRKDTRNLLAEARAAGYTLVEDRAGFDGVQATPVMGLFATSHMDYELDRDDAAQPSLAAMTRKAIDLLSDAADDGEGYLLMVEGSRIDHAGHSNDLAAHLHDILAFQDAAAVALSAARAQENTLVVVVSDHETGGMTLGRNINGRGLYAWEPSVLANVTASHSAMLSRLSADSTRTPVALLEEVAGIDDLSDAEIERLTNASGNMTQLNYALADVIARRAVVGWTSKGHTAVDVNVFAYGPGAARFAGNLDNTAIGQRLADLLGFDLAAQTEQLRARMEAEDASPDARSTTEPDANMGSGE
jgi:alkaline phosphatase